MNNDLIHYDTSVALVKMLEHNSQTLKIQIQAFLKTALSLL